MSHYLDRKRCEEAGLKYDGNALCFTIGHLEAAAIQKNVELLDKVQKQFSTQCAAFLESMYQKAGVITDGGAKEPEKTVAALCAPWMDINLLDPEWQKKWDAAHPKK